MFTGKILPFPNPYEKEYIAECKKNNIKPFSEELGEDNHDFFYEDYESFPDYIAYDYDTAGNTDSKKAEPSNEVTFIHFLFHDMTSTHFLRLPTQ